MHPRNTELKFLVLAAAVSSALYAELFLALGLTDKLSTFLLFAAPIFGALVLHSSLRVKKELADPFMLPLACLLTSISVAFIMRLDPELARLQAAWVTSGFMGAALITIFLKDVRRVAEYKYLLGSTALVLLVIPAFLGREIGGARLWIEVLGFSFQPGELAKVFLVLFLAAYFSEKRELIKEMSTRLLGMPVPHLRYLGPLLVMWVVSMLIMVMEKDLGSSLLFFATFIVLSYVATERRFFLAAGTVLFIAGASMSYTLFEHVAARVDVWLNPFADPLGQGYQITQSLFAISAGGFFGVGPGKGYGYVIPAAPTDMIASIIGEELGLLGISALFLLYALYFFSIIKTALASRDDFHKIAAAGFAINLFIQVFIILAGVSKFLPLTGITLNFVSYGGTSMMVNMLILTLILHFSDQEARS